MHDTLAKLKRFRLDEHGNSLARLEFSMHSMASPNGLLFIYFRASGINALEADWWVQRSIARSNNGSCGRKGEAWSASVVGCGTAHKEAPTRRLTSCTNRLHSPTVPAFPGTPLPFFLYIVFEL